METNEPPPALSRIKLALHFCLKVKSNPINPSYFCVSQPTFQDGFEGIQGRGPLGICMKPHFENLGLGAFHVSQVDLQKFAFWDYQHRPAILHLAQHKKDTTLPALYKSKYLEIRSMHEDHETLFTNGSKDR